MTVSEMIEELQRIITINPRDADSPIYVMRESDDLCDTCGYDHSPLEQDIKSVYTSLGLGQKVWIELIDAP